MNKQKETMIRLLRADTPISEIARILNVTRATIHRWKKEPLIAAELAQPNLAIPIQVAPIVMKKTDTEELVTKAQKCLETIMMTGENENARVSAAKYILERYERIAEEPEKENVINLKEWLS